MRHRDQLHGHFGFELESAVGSNGTRGKEQRGLWRHSSEVKSERRMNDADGDAANVKETCFLAKIIDTGDEDAVGGAGKTSETPVQRNDVAETENPQTGDVEPASHEPSLSSAAFDLMHDASNICRLCGKKLAKPYVLKRHIREVHLRIKCRLQAMKSNQHEFKKCPHCRAFFGTEAGLRRHVERHESGPDPVYECGECGRRL